MACDPMGPAIELRIRNGSVSEVLTLLAAGRSNKEIGRSLGVTERTVKAHVGNVMGKLGAASRTQAVIYALRHGRGSGEAPR